MQGRPGPVVLALPEDMLTRLTDAPVLPRVEPALAWPAPGALRDLRAMLLGGAAAVRDRRRQRLGRRGVRRRCSASPRAGSLPVGCAFRFQDLFDNRHPNYAGDVGIGINPKLAAAHRAKPTWSSRSARASAR